MAAVLPRAKGGGAGLLLGFGLVNAVQLGMMLMLVGPEHITPAVVAVITTLRLALAGLLVVAGRVAGIPTAPHAMMARIRARRA